MCQDQILKILKSRESTTETKSNAWDSRKKCHSYWPIGSMGLVYLPTWMVDFIWSVGRYTIHGSYGLCNCNISFLVSTLFRDRSCMAAVSTDRGWSQWLDFAVLWQHDASGHANRRGWSLYRLMSFCLGGLAFCRLVCGQSRVNYECWMIFFAPWASIKWYHQGGVEHYIVSFGVWLVDRFLFPKSDGDIVSWVVFFGFGQLFGMLWLKLWFLGVGGVSCIQSFCHPKQEERHPSWRQNRKLVILKSSVQPFWGTWRISPQIKDTE